MNQEKLKEYKTKLEKEKALMAEEIKRTERPIDFGSDIDHLEEEADEVEEVGNQLAVMQDLKNRFEEIVIALGKIQSGGYGVCENCGKEIGEEILSIDPESRFCKPCKEKKNAA